MVATNFWWIHICDLLSKNQYRVHSFHLIMMLLADFIIHWMTKIRGTNYAGTFCTSCVWTVKKIKYNLKMVSNVCRELDEVRKERLRQRRKFEKLRRERNYSEERQTRFLNLQMCRAARRTNYYIFIATLALLDCLLFLLFFPQSKQTSNVWLILFSINIIR